MPRLWKGAQSRSEQARYVPPTGRDGCRTCAHLEMRLVGKDSCKDCHCAKLCMPVNQNGICDLFLIRPRKLEVQGQAVIPFDA